MPKVTVTHNLGDTPAIAANSQRTVLVIQNNTTFNVRYRHFGGVSLSDETKGGLLLAAAPEAGKPGGSLMLFGALAQRAFYALHTGVGADVVQLDVEADAL